jgi:tetratricopeptide (TPR) repeat protein
MSNNNMTKNTSTHLFNRIALLATTVLTTVLTTYPLVASDFERPVSAGSDNTVTTTLETYSESSSDSSINYTNFFSDKGCILGETPSANKVVLIEDNQQFEEINFFIIKKEFDNYINEVNLWYSSGDYKKTIEYFKKALVLLGGAEYKSFKNQIYSYIGSIYLKDSQPLMAMEYFDKAELSDNEKMTLEKITIYYQNALQKLNNDTDKPLKAQINVGLGELYLEHKQPKNARYYYSQALNQLDENSDKKLISQIYFLHVDVSLQNRRQEVATYYSEKIIELFGKDDDKKLKAQTNIDIGEVFLKYDKRQTAINYYGHALELLGEDGDKKLKAQANICLGNAYFENEEPQFALDYIYKAIIIDSNIITIEATHEYCDKAIEQYRNNGRFNENKVFTLLGKIYLEKNQPLDALTSWYIVSNKYDYAKHDHIYPPYDNKFIKSGYDLMRENTPRIINQIINRNITEPKATEIQIEALGCYATYCLNPIGIKIYLDKNNPTNIIVC